MEHNILLAYGRYGPVAQLYKQNGLKSSLSKLERTIIQEHITSDLIVTGEFLFNIEEVLENAQLISESAKRLNSDIILTPCNGDFDRRFGMELMDINTIYSEVAAKYFTNAETNISDLYEPQAVSFIFGKDGLRHYIPKSLGTQRGQGVHNVPDRNYGISICYELWDNIMDPKIVENKGFILHPACEGDFTGVKARTLYLSGLSLEEIKETCEFVPDNILENIDFFVGPNKETLKKFRTPVITSNLNSNSTGISYMPDNWEVVFVKYTESYANLKLREL